MPHFYSVVSKQEIKSSEAWNLILHERTYWTDLDQRLHQDWHDDSLKHMGNVALGEPRGTREVRLLGTDASHCNGDAVFPFTRWNTHWDMAWQCSSGSLFHCPHSLCLPAVAQEHCSVVFSWSALRHRSLSTMTTGTTNSTLRPGELGINNQTCHAAVKHICVALSSRFPL